MRTGFFPLVIAPALLAGIDPAPAQTTNLNIAPAGNQLILFWPASVSGYVLQSTTNLASSNWLTVSNAIPVTAVTVPNASPAMYFRLAQPAAPGGMALIPAGVFTMGDPLDGEVDAIPTVDINVSDFYMDTNLVSYGQWQSVYTWAINNGYDFDNAGAGKGPNYPVETVDWYDALKWSNARSQQAGLTPVYYLDANFTQIYITGDSVPYVNWSATGYRLPTEAEWEKAARGGLSGQRFPWGDTISESQANYEGYTAKFSYDLGPSGFNAAYDTGSQPYTSPVGSFPPNGYGLYDMAGNLFQWCWDLYGTGAGGSDDYGEPTTNNPTGPTTVQGGPSRVVRGGNWSYDAYFQRCANRGETTPSSSSSSDNFVGVRCVRGH